MRLFITILLSLVLFTGCKIFKKKEKKAPTPQEKLESAYKYAEFELSDQTEKIVLLSDIKGVSYDTLYAILKDYYALTDDYQYSRDSLSIISQNTISTISKTYRISKLKVASLIFSFKYEMQTKEEIEQEAIDNLESEAQAEQESDDSRY